MLLLLAFAGTLPLAAQPTVVDCTTAAIVDALNKGTNHLVFRCATVTVTNPIVITGDVTIESTNRVTFNANNATRIFTVQPGASLTLNNVTLTGGKSTQGGAIFNRGQVFATKCIFAGNNATGTNGANGVNGRDDSFDPGNGGNGNPGVSGLGGAIFNDGTLVLTECTFSTNSATGGNGGAGGKGGNAINGAFTAGDGGNGGAGAPGRGGAVYNANYALVINCIFHRNTAAGGNGGAFGASGTGGLPGKLGRGGLGGGGSGAAVHNTWFVGIRGTTLSDNRADGGNSAATGGVSNSDGEDGLTGAEAWGGAVCNLNQAHLVNSTFSTNRVRGGDGGNGAAGEIEGGRGGHGGNGSGGNFFNNGSSAITNCTFAGGSAAGGTNGVGGAGARPGGPGTLGANRGGNLARLGGTLLLKNSIVARPGAGANGYGAIFDQGYNISSDASITLNGPDSRINLNPRIAGLADNQGFTRTFALLTNSPAIDWGDEFDSPEVDQRGFPIFGDYRDIGAYEYALSSISVFVGDVDGNPIAGVRIVGGGITNGATGGNGYFDFPLLTAGDYTITPSHPGYSFEPESQIVTLGPAVELFFTATRLFTVSGHVRDSVGGIDDVTIQAGDRVAVTDTNGFYQITGLAAGPYTVQPSADGYGFIPGLRQIDLQEDLTNVNFTAVGLHSISGRITAGAQGVPDVVVRAGNRSATTGPSGDYTITEVPEREQIVTPSRFGYSFNPPFLTLTPTGDENGIDFTAFPSFQVTGVVLNASNNLGANAVTLTLRTNTPPGPPPPGALSIVLLSGTNGTFAFTNLRAGSYVLTPSRPGHAFLPPLYSLTLPPDTNVTFQMSPAFFMNGRITAGGVGVSNVTMLAYTNGSVVQTQQTSANGNYTFTNLAGANYRLVPSLSGYDFDPTNRLVNLLGNSNGLDFVATGLYSISGVISNQGGAFRDVLVRAGGATAITDVDGRYTLNNLGPATYTVTPEAVGYSFLPANVSVTLSPSQTIRTNVNFQAVQVYTINGEVREGNFALVGVRISAGGVTNLTGEEGRYTLARVPAGTNVIVRATLPGYQFTPAEQSIVLDRPKNDVDFFARGLSAIGGRVTNAVDGRGLGNIRITVAGGRYQTNTAANGTYLLTNVGPGFLEVVPSFTNRGFNPVSRQVNVITNSVTNGVSFASFTAFNLTGRILRDETSNAMSGVTVRAVGNNTTNTATTDVNGRYEFKALRRAFYVLRPSLAGFGFEPQFVEFDLEADTVQDFIAFQGFSISGRILDGVNGVTNVQVQVNVPDILPVATDSNGNYVISGLREGDYNVIPVPIGYDVTPAERQVSVGPTNATGVNFAARGNLVVSGRVLDPTAGAANIQIRLIRTNSPALNRTAVSDATGTFTFSNITPGLVFLQPIQPTPFDLLSPTNIVLDPFGYEPPTFIANAGRLSLVRSNTFLRITLRALPGVQYHLQTNLNGVGPWADFGPRTTAANGVAEFFHPFTPASPPVLFRSRR